MSGTHCKLAFARIMIVFRNEECNKPPKPYGRMLRRDGDVGRSAFHLVC
jgi:hypothetical protein